MPFDWNKIDWIKVAQIIQLVVQMLQSAEVDGAKKFESSGTDQGGDMSHCSHEECCAQTFHAALCAANCAAHALQTCQDHQQTAAANQGNVTA